MNKNKLILPLLCISLLSGALASGIRSSFAYAEEGTWSEIGLQKNYSINSEVYLPDITYSIKGDSYRATPTVIFPNGVASANHTLLMDQVGQYKVIYSASTPEGVISKETSFSVSCGTFTLSGSESFATYGHDPLSQEVSSIYNVQSGYSSPELDGVYCRLAEGETITFNKYIDVSNVTEDDVLFSGYIAPESVGTNDFDEIDFILTDANDPDIWVRLCTRRRVVVDEKVGFASTRVKANNQVYGAINYDQIYPNAMDIYGSSQIMPFGGYASYLYQTPNKEYSYRKFETINNAHPFRFTLDSATMKMYNIVNFYTCTSKGATLEDYDWTPCLSAREKHIVTDLDNKDVYGNNLFRGFPSGKAQLSIFCDGYVNSYASFVITSILGTDITPDFDFKDTEAPEITIDCPYDILPEGKVGGTYPVFPATAFDEYSKNCDVDVEVIYNFNDENSVNVAVKDGYVVTEKPGWYAIIYTATDKSNNAASCIYKFHVGGQIEEITFEDFDPEYKTKKIGEMYTVAPYVVHGGSGNINVTASVTSPSGKSFEYTEPFRIEELGSWKVTYTALDMVGNTATGEYELIVIHTDNVYLNEEPNLPLAIISGGSYLIPEVKAISYSSTGERTTKTCKVKVFNQDGSEYETISSGDYLSYYSDINKTSLRLAFYIGEYNPYTEIFSKSIPAIVGINEETEEIYMENYFIGEGFNVSHDYNGTLIQVEKADDIEYMYANPLQVINFAMTLETIRNKTTYSGFDLKFQDVDNPSLTTTFKVGFTSSSTTLSFRNNEALINTSYLSGGDLQLNFKNDKIYLNNNVYLDVESYDNGEPFTSFPSHKAYVFIKMNDADTDSALYIKKFNNHDFTTDPLAEEFIDGMSPELFIFGGYGGHFRLNDVYETNIAFAADVICPNTELSLTVKNPDGKSIVKAEDPTDSYDLELDLFGSYKLSYTAEDTLVNITETKFNVFASDDQAPVITMEKDMVSSAEVNSNIYLPTFSATDDFSKEDEIVYKVFVIYPDNHKIALDRDTRYFKPVYAGLYSFRFIAEDKYGNASYVNYDVNVK